jgi:membrane protein DedA with SNARE-associated domain
LQEHAAKTIFLMAMIPKLRFLSPIISGASNIKFRLFLLVNSAATLLYTVFYFLLGIIFYRQLNNVIHRLSYLQHIIFIASMILIAGFSIFMIRNFIRKKDNSAAN